MMPLTLAEAGEENIIRKIGGNVIANVKDSRIAASRGMAQKIMA